MATKLTKKDYEEWLNDLGDDIGEVLPERKAMGGRMPNRAKYGTWIRKNDPVAFNVGFNEWASEGKVILSASRKKEYRSRKR